jgi:hypothetical protein
MTLLRLAFWINGLHGLCLKCNIPPILIRFGAQKGISLAHVLLFLRLSCIHRVRVAFIHSRQAGSPCLVRHIKPHVI